MKKLAFAVLGVLSACALRAEDSYLYWMIGSEAAASFATEMGVSSLEGYTAKLWSDAGNEYLNLYPVSASAPALTVTSVDAVGAQLAGVVASLGGSPSGSFFVELWNSSGLQGRSQEYTYQSLQDYIGTVKFTSSWPKNAFALVGGFRAVPEPSSGLMLLIGLSALALRRKKRV